MARRFKTSKAKRVSQKKYRKARKQYNDYLDQFEARKENFESRGLDFFDPVPLTFRDYRTVHAEKLNDLKQDIKEGKRKTVGNVNREIVSDQAYELSSRQADVLGEYLLENEPELLEEMDLVYKYTDDECYPDKKINKFFIVYSTANKSSNSAKTRFYEELFETFIPYRSGVYRLPDRCYRRK